MSFQDHFGTLAQGYATYRPNYPASLFEAILDYAGPAPRDVAVDVGAGTGQATAPLAAHFKRVVAVEPSEGQFQMLTSLAQNIECVLAPAEKIDTVLPPNSVDLLVTAQAAHWFDLDQFWRASHAVLRPGATLAIWGYGTTQLSGSSDDAEANRLFLEFYDRTLGPQYWPPNRAHIDNRYQSIVPSHQLFEHHVRREDLAIEQETTMDSFFGYLNTWSGLKNYRAANNKKTGQEEDPLVPLRARLEKLYGAKRLRTRFSIFLLLAKKRL